jgi:methyl-accepting chemotaxis protein
MKRATDTSRISSTKLSNRLLLLLTLNIAGLLSLATYAIYNQKSNSAKIVDSQSRAQINGDIYHAMIQCKDVIADVLPPPKYIIEPFLTACQIADATSPDEINSLVQHMQALQKEYQERQSFWLSDLKDPTLKKTLTLDAHQPAARFFKVFEEDFLPAIRSGDHTQAQNILTQKLAREYKHQRQAVDQVVELASTITSNKEAELQTILATSERETQQANRFATTSTLFSVIALATLITSIGWRISSSVTRTIQTISHRLQLGSQQVLHSADQVSTSSQSLAEGASEQAASLEETSSSLEEMSSMTQRNASHTQKATELARSTRQAADQSSDKMQAMTNAMDAIKNSSDDIARILKTIDEIAFQTNLLALNAAVEAARAGEAGMGFAVVAEEVRNLAQRSATAARETATKIETAIANSQQGVEISQSVAASLHNIVSQIREVDELVAEVASASQEQSHGITQINGAVTEMDQVTQRNAATAEESAAAATELHDQAESIMSAVNDLLAIAGSSRQQSKPAPEPKQPPAPTIHQNHPPHSPKRSAPRLIHA